MQKSNVYGTKVINKLSYLIKIAVIKFISLPETVSTEVTLIRNSVEIDKKDHTIIENMRQSGNSLV